MSAKILVIFLHGIGASGSQLLPLASSWRPTLPDARFAAPNAPYVRGQGHQWFSVEGNPLSPDRIRTVRGAFDALINGILKNEGFQEAHHRVAFVGVSQGAIIALDGIASGRWQIGALVSFAGLLPPQPVSSDSKSTPILLIHGQNDRSIPAATSTSAAMQLRAAGFKVELDIEPGVGHTISQTGASRALAFLQKSLA